MKRILFVCIANFFFSPFTFSQQPGALDNTFGTNGYVYGTVNTGFFQFGGTKIQSDGKIVVMGRVKNGSDDNIGLIRFNANGTIDNTFGTNGEVHDMDDVYSDLPLAMTLQQDDKILVSSSSGNLASVTRFNTDGTRDNTFGTGGRATYGYNGATYSDAWGIDIQADGKIVTAGSSSFAPMAARLNSDGTLDTSFGVNGIAAAPGGMTLFCMKLSPDGKVLLGGRTSKFCLGRLNSDGSIDNTFGTGGKVETTISGNLSWIQGIHFIPGGGIIATGSNYTSNPQFINFTVVKYSSDGVVDNSFGINGIAEDSVAGKFIQIPTSAVLQPDGKIVFAGETADAGSLTQYSLLRMNGDGSRDLTFGSSGIVVSQIGPTGFAYPTSLAIQPDNKIVVGGYVSDNTSNFLNAARYHGGDISSTHDLIAGESLSIFPNPATDLITINYSLNRKELISIYLKDIFGKIVQPVLFEEDQTCGNHSLTIQIKNKLPSGVYFICISNSVTVKQVKMIRN